MKKALKISVFLFMAIAFMACKKETDTPEEPVTPPTETVSGTPTEGNIQIADTQNDAVKYDDKTVTIKSFNIEKILPTILNAYAQITVQSADKDGIFNKYSIGINLLTGLPATGVKTSILSGTTPVLGLNLYQNGALYSFSAMNGSFIVDSNDGHNAVITLSDIDMKQSYMQGFDASLKRFRIKSFKLKIAY